MDFEGLTTSNTNDLLFETKQQESKSISLSTLYQELKEQKLCLTELRKIVLEIQASVKALSFDPKMITADAVKRWVLVKGPFLSGDSHDHKSAAATFILVLFVCFELFYESCDNNVAVWCFF